MKIRVLIAVHLVLSVLPLAIEPLANQFPYDIGLSLVRIGAQSVSIGQLMLLAFWAALGTTHWIWRIAGAIAGTGYVAFWWTIPSLLSPKSSWATCLQECGAKLLVSGLLVFIIGSGFLVMRRWFFHLDRDAEANDPSPSSGFQFLIHTLLIVVTATSMFLVSRQSDFPSGQWKLLVGSSMWLGVFAANAIYAVRGILSRGPIRWHLLAVLLVAVLAGTGITLLTTRLKEHLWEGPISGMITTVPTFVMILSLLVVRSCGYRLVPNPPTRIPGVLNVSASPS